MRSLLEFRDKVKYYYRKYEFVLLPVLKFMLAYLTLCCVNGAVGYMSGIDKVGIVLITSLLCSFLPVGFIVFVTLLFSLLHMYALSMEVALVGLCIYVVLLLLFMRFDSKHIVLAVITAICAAMKIPYVVPIIVGLLATPVASVSVVCGLIVYSMINLISQKATVINTMGSGEEIAKVRMVLDGLIKNKELMVMLVAFVITISVVYVIRRMRMDYAWSIAMVTGAIINIVVILVGDLIYDTKVSLLAAILASLLALVIAKIVEFMCFCVDYSRTENVQFEDDEYYYYVKAVPKMSVAAQSKTVKKINSQRTVGTQRRVVTERTESGRTVPRSSASRGNANIRNTTSGNRSVTIGEYLDDNEFEDLD